MLKNVQIKNRYTSISSSTVWKGLFLEMEICVVQPNRENTVFYVPTTPMSLNWNFQWCNIVQVQQQLSHPSADRQVCAFPERWSRANQFHSLKLWKIRRYFRVNSVGNECPEMNVLLWPKWVRAPYLFCVCVLSHIQFKVRETIEAVVVHPSWINWIYCNCSEQASRGLSLKQPALCPAEMIFRSKQVI